MKGLVEYINEHINEEQDGDVYAIVDFTGAIQGVYPTQTEADEALKDLPKESEAKVQKMKKSEIMK